MNKIQMIHQQIKQVVYLGMNCETCYLAFSRPSLAGFLHQHCRLPMIAVGRFHFTLAIHSRSVESNHHFINKSFRGGGTNSTFSEEWANFFTSSNSGKTVKHNTTTNIQHTTHHTQLTQHTQHTQHTTHNTHNTHNTQHTQHTTHTTHNKQTRRGEKKIVYLTYNFICVICHFFSISISIACSSIFIRLNLFIV